MNDGRQFANADDVERVYSLLDRPSAMSEISIMLGIPFSAVRSAIRILEYKGDIRCVKKGRAGLYQAVRKP